MKDIPYGYCQCGCGGVTEISKKTRTKQGYIKGKPNRFIAGHNSIGNLNPRWIGGRRYQSGYVEVFMESKKFILEHRAIVERVLGRPVPVSAVVHHHDGVKDHNDFGNLVVCENNSYHLLLHQRMRAYQACGHSHWRKCWICKEWDDPQNMYLPKKPRMSSPIHRKCGAEYAYRRKHERRLARWDNMVARQAG